MTTPETEFKLFVGSVPAGTTHEELVALFKQYGEPDEVHVVPKAGFKGLHYGFVRYPQKDMADAAIAALNGKHTLRLSTEPITVRFSERSRNSGQTGGPSFAPANPQGAFVPHVDDGFKLFVGNLPLSITKEALNELFSPYGEVREVVMLKAGRGTHLSAFVKFAMEVAATAAIEALDGKHTMQDATTGQSTTIQVRPRVQQPPPGPPAPFAHAPIARSGGAPPSNHSNHNSNHGHHGRDEDGFKLFVGNLPLSVTSEELRGVFGPFGAISEVVMLKAGRGTHLSAFVKMATEAAAHAAAAALDSKRVMRDSQSGAETTIQVRPRYGPHDGKGGLKPEAVVHAGAQHAKPPHGGHGGAAAPEEAKLFVGNLPLAASKDAIQRLFEAHGAVREVVMLGAGRGTHLSCFVKMATLPQAQAAIHALDARHQMHDPASGQPTTIQVRWATKDKRKRPDPDPTPFQGPGMHAGPSGGGGGGWGSGSDLGSATRAAYEMGIMAAMQHMQAAALQTPHAFPPDPTLYPAPGYPPAPPPAPVPFGAYPAHPPHHAAWGQTSYSPAPAPAPAHPYGGHDASHAFGGAAAQALAGPGGQYASGPGPHPPHGGHPPPPRGQVGFDPSKRHRGH